MHLIYLSRISASSRKPFRQTHSGWNFGGIESRPSKVTHSGTTLKCLTTVSSHHDEEFIVDYWL